MINLEEQLLSIQWVIQYLVKIGVDVDADEAAEISRHLDNLSNMRDSLKLLEDLRAALLGAGFGQDVGEKRG